MIPDTLSILNAYWSAFYGVAVDGPEASGVCLVPHRGMGDYQGLFLFRTENGCIVSHPEDFPAETLRRFYCLAANELFDPVRLDSLLRERVAAIIGPAWTGYVDRPSLRVAEFSRGRRLGPDDQGALTVLQQSSPEKDWNWSGLGVNGDFRYGVFEGELMVSAAICRSLDTVPGIGPGGTPGDIGILTHPDRRGQGYARVAAQGLAHMALASYPVLRWQTLETNLPSLGVASSLGFVPYARTIAVRLTSSG